MIWLLPLAGWTSESVAELRHARSTATPFPVRNIDGTVYAAIDRDPETSWRTVRGEVATFDALPRRVVALRLHGKGGRLALRVISQPSSDPCAARGG